MMKITLIHKSSKQKLILNADNSEIGFKEIKKSLRSKDKIDSIGLIAPDIEVLIKDENEIKHYELYDRGYIIMNPKTHLYSFFEFGHKWYELMQKNIHDILLDNPEYFLHPQLKKASTKKTVLRSQRTPRENQVFKPSPSFKTTLAKLHADKKQKKVFAVVGKSIEKKKTEITFGKAAVRKKIGKTVGRNLRKKPIEEKAIKAAARKKR